MKKLALLSFLVLSIAGFASAATMPDTAPEIDASQAVTAIALLSGTVLVVRSRRRS